MQGPGFWEGPSYWKDPAFEGTSPQGAADAGWHHDGAEPHPALDDHCEQKDRSDVPVGVSKGRFASPPPMGEGILELPKGKIAAIATYLEMHEPPSQPPAPSRSGAFEAIGRNPSRYRALYRDVGERWLWFSRARLNDADLDPILRSPAVEALAYRIEGRDVGMVELDFRRGAECELSFLGLVPDAIGGGHGRVLMAEAIARAFARPIGRLWLHTCTLDHPNALGFYIRSGFRPFRRAIEVANDPRLTGHLPSDAAPDLPIL